MRAALALLALSACAPPTAPALDAAAIAPDARVVDAAPPPPDADPNALVHPGMTSTDDELDRVRALVDAPGPAQQGWQKLLATRFAELDYEPTPYAIVHVVGSGGNAEERAMRNDAVAAYAHALQWVITGDDAHRAKAIEILDAWAATLEDVVPASGSDPSVQDELETAWYGPTYLAAAELVRHHDGGAAGWDSAPFESLVTLFRAKADAWNGQACCPNQSISVLLSRASIGVYTDDRAYLQAAIDDFTGTVLDRAIAADGEILEINRIDGGDCPHATFNVEGIFELAEIAWHQHIDLYAEPRLPLGLEYMATCITAGVDTSHEGRVACTGTRPVSIETAYNHYVQRLGAELPRTRELLDTIRPVDQGTGKFLPWDTLTHGELDPP